MAQTEQNSFQNEIKNYAKFHNSTSLPHSVKKKRDLAIATRQIIFGFNKKSDNAVKTKQLKLF